MRTKVAYIISHIDKALAFEWIAKYLDQRRIELSFILLNEKGSDLEDFLRTQGIPVSRVYYKSKKNLPGAFLQVWKILKRRKVNIVHAHLFDASIIGLSAAFLAGIKRRIHTRHNSTIHHRYFPTAVKYDKFINFLSTDIVAISNVVKKVLVEMEGAHPDKVRLIHHGFFFDDIPDNNSERIVVLKKKYNPHDRRPVIGVVSRYIHWKGIQYIIPAFKMLLDQYPNALLVLANASGSYSEEIKKLLSPLPPTSYREIGFEKDIFALYKLFDIFIHVPIDESSEAFGQTYVEALSVGIPSIVTYSGIAHEFINHEINALVVKHKDSTAIYDALTQLLNDEKLCKNLSLRGAAGVISRFSLEKMINKLEKLYLNDTHEYTREND